jgi:hypothetical protein
MKPKNLIIPVLVAGVLLSLLAPLSASNQKDQAQNKQAPKPQEKVFIPKEVKAVLQEGLAARQGREDIPVNIFHSLFLPAQQNFQIIFFMKIKNSDLGYAPASATPAAAPAAPQPEVKPETVPAAQEAALLEAKFNVFLEFNRLEEGAEPQIFKEVYVPSTIQVEEASFDAEKEDMYSIGYPLPFGHYLLALAVTSPDLQKIGTAYCEFTLPDTSAFAKALETTPIFFIKSFEKMDGPETHTVFHKELFTYSFLKIVPNLDKIFAAGDTLDTFFYVFGARPNEQQKYDIEVNFEVKKGEEIAIRWAPQTYDISPLVSQPLPLKQTVIIKSQAGERTEQRDLTAGNYTLVVSVSDKVSGNSVTKTVDFEVK